MISMQKNFSILMLSLFLSGTLYASEKVLDQAKKYLEDDIVVLKKNRHFFARWEKPLDWDNKRWDRLFQVLGTIVNQFSFDWFEGNQKIFVEHIALIRHYISREKENIDLSHYFLYLSLQRQIILKAETVLGSQGKGISQSLIKEYCSAVLVYVKDAHKDTEKYIKMLRASTDLLVERIKKIEHWIDQKNKIRLLGGGFFGGKVDRLFEKYYKELEEIFHGIILPDDASQTAVPIAALIAEVAKIASLNVFEILNPKSGNSTYLCTLKRYQEITDFLKSVQHFARNSFNFCSQLTSLQQKWNQYLGAEFFTTKPDPAYLQAKNNFNQKYLPFLEQKRQMMKSFVEKRIRNAIEIEKEINSESLLFFMQEQRYMGLQEKSVPEIMNAAKKLSIEEYVAFFAICINDLLTQKQPKLLQESRQTIEIPEPSAPLIGE
jgi:hypothetical protein